MNWRSVRTVGPNDVELRGLEPIRLVGAAKVGEERDSSSARISGGDGVVHARPDLDSEALKSLCHFVGIVSTMSPPISSDQCRWWRYAAASRRVR